MLNVGGVIRDAGQLARLTRRLGFGLHLDRTHQGLVISENGECLAFDIVKEVFEGVPPEAHSRKQSIRAAALSIAG